MEILSKVHEKNLVEWAKDKPEVVVLSADLTASTEANLFRDTYPNRFFSMGVAEQNMLSFAGGLAREGFFPFVHTFAVFIYRRALDQVAMSVAYPNLPVRMLGFLPGVTTPGGATHQAIEDLAVMRSLPNMTVMECGDATDVASVLEAAHSVDGPVYVRMLRGQIPRLFPADQPMRVGKVRQLSSGDDLALFSSGICTQEAMQVVQLCSLRGVRIHHIHVSTLKPFDDPAVEEAISGARLGVISLENHSIMGGLGTALAEKMAEGGCGKRLLRLGIRDRFLHGASREHLMREYDLDASALVGAIERLVGQDLGIGAEELRPKESPPKQPVAYCNAKAEAL